MTIWVVEHGEYDDYEVGPAFTNEAAAQKYIDRMNEIYTDETYVWNAWPVYDECPEIHVKYSKGWYRDRIDPSRGPDDNVLALAMDEPVTLEVVVTDDLIYVDGPSKAEVLKVFKERYEESGWDV